MSSAAADLQHCLFGHAGPTTALFAARVRGFDLCRRSSAILGAGHCYEGGRSDIRDPIPRLLRPPDEVALRGMPSPTDIKSVQFRHRE